MPLRSKSVPPKTPKKAPTPPPDLEHEELGEEVEVLPPIGHEDKKKKKPRKSSTKKRAGSASRHHSSRHSTSIADRPEWNNDTHIDGYDDLDENGKVKRQGVMHTLNGEKSRKEQEEMNKNWMESLRG